MDMSDRSVKSKLGLLRLADKLGSVTKACETLGYSRDSYYRFKSLYDRGGPDALRDITRRKPVLKNRVSADIESAVMAASLANPTAGQQRIAQILAGQGITISSSGVRSIWVRSGIETIDKRLMAILTKSQQDGLPLTSEQASAINRARSTGKLKPGRMVTHPGMICFQDLVQVGEHPVFGPLHVMTFVDAYSRFAFTEVSNDVVGFDAVAFLNDRVFPWFEKSGMRIESIRTDRRMPFIDNGRMAYKESLRQRNISHLYRLSKSRSREDAGQEFVSLVTREVFQPIFRAADIQEMNDLRQRCNNWLHLYNYERAQAGPCCYGKTPARTFGDASRFWGSGFDLPS